MPSRGTHCRVLEHLLRLASHQADHMLHPLVSSFISRLGTGPPQRTLQRQLKNRHIAMISIGGVIGTGLFVGTANSLSWGGPLGLLLGYIIMGSIVYSVMITLGEMVAFLPIPGGHIKLAERFIDPTFSFAMGWNYWYNWTIVSPERKGVFSASSNCVDPFYHSISYSPTDKDEIDRATTHARRLLIPHTYHLNSNSYSRNRPWCFHNTFNHPSGPMALSAQS